MSAEQHVSDCEAVAVTLSKAAMGVDMDVLIPALCAILETAISQFPQPERARICAAVKRRLSTRFVPVTH